MSDMHQVRAQILEHLGRLALPVAAHPHPGIEQDAMQVRDAFGRAGLDLDDPDVVVGILAGASTVLANLAVLHGPDVHEVDVRKLRAAASGIAAIVTGAVGVVIAAADPTRPIEDQARELLEQALTARQLDQTEGRP